MISLNKSVTVLSIFVILIAILYKYFSPVLSPVVQILDGKVQGIVSVSREGKEFYSFMGIPYGKKPIGDLRFEDPLPSDPWDGVLNKWFYENVCLQYESFLSGITFGSEDCLYLNVFTPKLSLEKTGDLLATLVYFHGGYFQVGSPMMAGPKYLMDENVILVTVNYRLGVLGFLSTGDDVVRGNMGLKDQNMALKWVKRNIKFFNGSASKVTIFGESAGGASVHFQLLAPSSKGLFTNAIHQSGSSLNYWTVYRNVKEQSKRYAKKFNCPTSDSKEMVQCMRKIDPRTFVGGESDQQGFFHSKITYFVPTIETVKDEKAFMTEEPIQLLKTGRFPKVDIMSGFNSREGLVISPRIFLNQTRLNEANENWETWIPRVLQYSENQKSIASKLCKFYFGDNVKEINDTKFAQKFTEIIGDRYFSNGVIESIHLQSKFTPTYTYYYDHEGEFRLGDIVASTQGILYPPITFLFHQLRVWFQSTILGKDYPHIGASHADESALLFSKLWFLDILFPKHKDIQISKDLVKLWADFAKGKTKLKFRGIEIPLTRNETLSSLKFLRISNNPTVIKDLDEVRRKLFWDSLNIIEE